MRSWPLFKAKQVLRTLFQSDLTGGLMTQALHSQARTTHLIREEIKKSTLPQAELAPRYNVTRQTIRKWQDRDSPDDGSHCPKTLKTTLTPEQELIVIELCKTLLLPIDDLLAVTREFINPAVSRAGLGRCLRRHGVSRLLELAGQETDKSVTKKSFKDYEHGFVHMDIKYLRTYGYQVLAANAR